VNQPTERLLHLVRHGRPRVQPGQPADDWGLDPDGLPGLVALRDSGDLPRDAAWFCSPEPKAVATARFLHPGPLTVVPGLEEQHRGSHWFDDESGLRAAVRRAFADRQHAAAPGWEPLAVTEQRVVSTARRLLAEHADEEIVLVGHGTAFTVLVSALTGSAPDLDAWTRLPMPGLWSVSIGVG
jgi:broad specificity phosphatase PhoE